MYIESENGALLLSTIKKEKEDNKNMIRLIFFLCEM